MGTVYGTPAPRCVLIFVHFTGIPQVGPVLNGRCYSSLELMRIDMLGLGIYIDQLQNFTILDKTLTDDIYKDE